MNRAASLKQGPPDLLGAQLNESVDSGAPSPHFLHAGKVYVSSEGQTIVLILGSCVAVCMWDAVHAVGGATHYLLPAWDERGVASPRYGNVAISALLQELVEKGADRKQLHARIFGGGCLFDAFRASSSIEANIGRQNVRVAQEILTNERLPIVSTKVGADRGQRIVFHTDTGVALVTTL
jgi:chemotaxis protein CheD